MSSPVALTTPGQRLAGLTEAEADDRRRSGCGNDEPLPTSRSVADIVRGNVLTRFNALLGSLLVVILVVGPLQDALFGLVLIANSGVGIIQELRAKRTLDRLGVVNAARARILRDGVVRLLPATDVVVDDLIAAAPGDQVVVDGEIVRAAALEVDESLLTGESDPISKSLGDPVLSGSFIAAGEGYYRATRVGGGAYAARLAAEARRFTLVSSELRDGINRLLRVITWVMVPTAGLLLWSQFAHNSNLPDAVRGSVAGVVTMVPEGLVLLTSIAFAVGVIRLGRRRVLVQELPAIETLARVDVIGLDKTGTLTTGALSLVGVEPLGPGGHDGPLGALAAADPYPNPTLRALANRFPDPGWTAFAAVPFSAERRWSGATFSGHGSWILGAPDRLSAQLSPDDRRIVESGSAAHQQQGHRVLLLTHTPDVLSGPSLPEHLAAAAIVVLADTARPEAATTLRYFREQRVAVKVLSGDHPETVARIAASLGLPGAGNPIDASALPDDHEALAAAAEAGTVFGRVDPHRKRALIRALQERGHVVAMTGDGVNDVLALKDSDVGIAMGSGSPATRAVAQLVLLDNRFDGLPAVVAEGRRVIGNIERVANLFLTKTVYATVLALAVGAAMLPFPFLPRHLTLISTFTIGLPGFVLALGPNDRRALSGFVGRVMRFAVPAGLVAAAATFLAYAEARETKGLSLGQARTTATLVLFGVALLVLARLGRPQTRTPGWLYLAMALGFGAALAVPISRSFFALPLPGLPALLSAFGVVAVAGVVLEIARRLVERFGGSGAQGLSPLHRHKPAREGEPGTGGGE